MYFLIRILSYFAEPNYIKYDEWFDDDLEKVKNGLKNKKIKTISNIHEFFYEQSNYKVGASENNLQLDITSNTKELITYNYLENTSKNNNPLSNKKFSLLAKFPNSKFKFGITKKVIYFLSISSLLIIFGFLIFFIASTNKSKSNVTKIPLTLERNFF